MSALRHIDHIAGSLYINAASLFHRKRDLPHTIRSIGMLKTRGIGDLVVASCLIREIKSAYKDVLITMYADKYTHAACDILHGIDHSVLVDSMHPLQSIRTIRESTYDIFIDLGAWPRMDAIMSCSARSQCTVGFSTAGQHRHKLFDIAVPHLSSQHEVCNYMDIARAIGIANPTPSAWILGLSELRPLSDYDEFRHNNKYIIMHSKAGGSNPAPREWSNEKWVEVAGWCADRGYSIVLSGSSHDRKSCRETETRMDRAGVQVINISGKYSLLDSLPILYNSAAVLSVNTGLMHIAAACNVPTIALCGPTNPLRWGPIGEKAISITPEKGECCYLDLGFEYKSGDSDCMDNISVKSVIDALKSVV